MGIIKVLSEFYHKRFNHQEYCILFMDHYIFFKIVVVFTSKSLPNKPPSIGKWVFLRGQN